MRYTNTFLIHIFFWFILLITTSQSAGVLHVPACKHDRPPLPGFTFMYMRCVPYNHPYWLCLSPHPKPFRHRRGQSTVMATMKKTRYLKISTFMRHKPIPSLLHIKKRMRIRNIHTNYRCILFYHIRFSLFYY